MPHLPHRRLLRRLVTATALLVAVSSASASGADWPQWRGPQRTGISSETGLLTQWPAGGPRRLWVFAQAGNGYSAPAIVAGKLYTLGTRDSREILLVLDAATGAELWTLPLGAVLGDDRGNGPRGTPTVTADRLYALTGPGQLVCVDLADRTIRWQTSMKELGGAVPRWGYSESVVVDGDLVLCTPGGAKGAVAAFDQATGTLRWQSKEFTDAAHYSTIVPARINGALHYVQRSEKSIVGLDPATGARLWHSEFPGRVAVIPTPVVRDNLVYVTAGYGVGCKLIRIDAGNRVETVYENKVMKNHHGGVVLIGDHLYGHNDNAWVCQDFKTGEEVWSDQSVGKGAIVAADGLLYLLDESKGTVVLAAASPAGWSERGRFTLDPQSKIRSARGMIWTHPVISHGRLYLRDQDLISCYDLRSPR